MTAFSRATSAANVGSAMRRALVRARLLSSSDEALLSDPKVTSARRSRGSIAGPVEVEGQGAGQRLQLGRVYTSAVAFGLSPSWNRARYGP